MAAEDPYTPPRAVEHLSDCYFYHVMELPGVGLVGGQWDLRDTLDDYLGHCDFSGKRVLDIGAASGYVSFEIEKRGAEVVSADLARGSDWDIVPYVDERFDLAGEMDIRTRHLKMLHNGYWFAHRAYNSHAKVYHGNIYALPDELGKFDIVILGAILLHLRDPFLAMKSAARLCADTIIVTDLTYENDSPVCMFVPNAERLEPKDTWWLISERAMTQMIMVMGFPELRTSRASHRILHRPDQTHMQCTTYVGKRK